MNYIAQAKEGDFHFVEHAGVIPECFSDCLGGLVSLVADEIHVSLELQETLIPCAISKVFNDEQSNYFRMPQLFSGDTKDTVFMLSIFPYEEIVEQEITIAPVKVDCAYRMVKSGQEMTQSCVLQFAVDEGEGLANINEDVYVHHARVRAAEIMKMESELANSGDLEGARNVCKEGIAEVRKSPVQKTQQCERSLMTSRIQRNASITHHHGNQEDELILEIQNVVIENRKEAQRFQCIEMWLNALITWMHSFT